MLRNLGLLFGVSVTLLLAACGTSARQIDLAQVSARPDRAIIVFSLHVPEGQEQGGWGGGPAPTTYAVDLDRYDLDRQAMVGGCFRRRDVVQAEIPNTPGRPIYLAFDVPTGAYVVSPFIPHGHNREQAWIVPKGSVTYVGAFSRKTTGPHPLNFNATAEHSDELEQARRDTGLILTPAQVVDVVPPRPYICTP
ncbi:hypothetical protein [Brevundimonas sp.]